MELCYECKGELPMFKKKCKLCNEYFCKNCTIIEDKVLIFIGKRYCLKCWTILKNSEEDERKKNYNMEDYNEYFKTGEVPDEVLIEQAKMLSIIESSWDNKNPNDLPNNSCSQVILNDYPKLDQPYSKQGLYSQEMPNVYPYDKNPKARKYDEKPLNPKKNPQRTLSPQNQNPTIFMQNPKFRSLESVETSQNKVLIEIPDEKVQCSNPPPSQEYYNQHYQYSAPPPQYTDPYPGPMQPAYNDYLGPNMVNSYSHMQPNPYIPYNYNPHSNAPMPYDPNIVINQPYYNPSGHFDQQYQNFNTPTAYDHYNPAYNVYQANPPPGNYYSPANPHISPQEPQYNYPPQPPIPSYPNHPQPPSYIPNHPPSPPIPTYIPNHPPIKVDPQIPSYIPNSPPVKVDPPNANLEYIPPSYNKIPPQKQPKNIEENKAQPLPPAKNQDIPPSYQKISPQKPLRNIEENKAQPPVAKIQKKVQEPIEDQRSTIFIPTNFNKNNPTLIYKLHKKIGNGGFGEVFISQKISTNETFAVKILKPKTLQEKELIKNEISLTQNSNHPNIIKFYENFDFRNSIWIIEELMSCSLTDFVLDRPGQIPEMVLKYVLYEVLKGLEYLHKRNRIHRDIKSDNILISEKGEIKIADLGAAAQLNNMRNNRNTFVGTLLWMPPEILKEENYGTKVDIWALGIVAIELAEGEPPNYKENQQRIVNKIVSERPPELRNPRKWSLEFNDFLSKCLVKDQNRRQSPSELLLNRFFNRVEGCREGFLEYFNEWSRNR